MSDDMSDDGGLMDGRNVDELIKKMHEEKDHTVDYLRESFSEEELADLNREITAEIELSN